MIASKEPKEPKAPKGSRALFILITLLLIWTGVLAVSGGVDLHGVGLPLSSRNPSRPALAAIVLMLVYAAAFRQHTSADVATLQRAIERAGPALAVALSLLTPFLGLRFGSFVAGGADSYGYVSQADLWLAGDLIVEQPFTREFPWPHADWTFTPLGYRPALSGGAIVPIYAPGLPLLMALAKKGMGACGPYVVAPAFGALIVGLTYLLGARLISRGAGLGAAALLTSSPPFVASLVAPMGDVPVAGLLLAAVVLALSTIRARAFWTGLAVAAAILVRPNLMPLAVVFALYVWYRTKHRRERTIAVTLFGAGLLPAVLAIAIIHTHLYGAPWRAGYGDLSGLYSLQHAAANIVLYPKWLVQTATPFIAACLIPFAAWRRLPGDQRTHIVLLASLTVVVCLSYVFFLPHDSWDYLRFLLPAFPLMLVLAMLGCRMLFSGLPSPARTIALTTLVLLVVGYQVRFVRESMLLQRWEAESTFPSVGRFVDRTLPRNAVLLSMFHSGSIRHYSGRLTMRYDWLDREWWPRALDVLSARGYRPYVVLADWEEAVFRRQLGLESGQRFGAVVAELPGSVVRIYDPFEPVDLANGPVRIPPTIACPCTCEEGARE